MSWEVGNQYKKISPPTTRPTWTQKTETTETPKAEAAASESPEAAAPKTTGEIKGLWKEAKTVGKFLKNSFLLVQGGVGYRKPQMKEGLGKLKTKLSEAKSKISERKTEEKSSPVGLKGVYIIPKTDPVTGEVKTYDAINIPEMAKGMGNKKLTDEQFTFLLNQVIKDFDVLVNAEKEGKVNDLGGEERLPMIYSLIQNLGKNMTEAQKEFLFDQLQERANKYKDRLEDGFAVLGDVADLYTSDQSAISGELNEMCGQGTAETLNNLLIQHNGNVYSILNSMCRDFLGKPLEEPPPAAPAA